MKPGYVLLVIGMVMILMTAVFTSDTGLLDQFCQVIWAMLHDPKFWTIGGYAWGSVLALLGIIHLVVEKKGGGKS